MAVYRWSAADEKMISEIVDPETLVKRLPRLADFYEGIHEMRALQEEISTLGSLTRRTGFTPGKNFHRIGTIPYSVAAAIVEVDPEFFRDRGKVYRFLASHPEYDTRTTLK